MLIFSLITIWVCLALVIKRPCNCLFSLPESTRCWVEIRTVNVLPKAIGVAFTGVKVSLFKSKLPLDLLLAFFCDLSLWKAMFTSNKSITCYIVFVKSVHTNVIIITLFSRRCAVDCPFNVAYFLFSWHPIRERYWKTFCLSSLFLTTEELNYTLIYANWVLPSSCPLTRCFRGTSLSREIPVFHKFALYLELLQTNMCIGTVCIFWARFTLCNDTIQLVHSCGLCQQKGESS